MLVKIRFATPVQHSHVRIISKEFSMVKQALFHETQEAWQNEALEGGQYVLLVGENTPFSQEKISPFVTVFGAVFPYVIYQGKHHATGILSLLLEEEAQVTLVPSMAEPSLEGKIALQNTLLFVIVDGLSSYIVEFLEALFEEIPPYGTLFGGGSGKLTLVQEPLIFDNQLRYKDAALIVQAPAKMGLGVGHGWRELLGPMIATKTTKNILEELNYKNAFSVYRQLVEQDSGQTLSTQNFFDIAKSYPFGVSKYGGEVIVRDPITTDGSALVLVGEMEQNSVIFLLKGEEEVLIEAAGKAASEALMELGQPPRGVFIVDCVSRVLFLGDAFVQELASVAKNTGEALPQWGILTLGEIANKHDGNIEFYNKTCVVGVV